EIESRTIVGELDSTENGETDDIKITYTYDYNGNLLTVTDEFGRTTSATYNSVELIATETDEYGNVTLYRYDSRDQLVQTIYNYGTTYEMSSESVYDEKSRVIFSTSSHKSGETALGTEYVYDAVDRVTSVKQYEGSTVSVTQDGNVYASDIYGKGTLLSSSAKTFDPVSGRLVSATDDQGVVAANEYNEYGDVTTTSRTFGSQPELISQYVYDSYGNQVEVINSKGQHSYTVYDSYGREVRTIDNQNRETTTTYDDIGRVKSRTFSNGGRLDFSYDSFGRRTEVKQTKGSVVQITTYEYDENSNVTEMIDPYSRKTTYEYDDFGREVSSTYHPTGDVSLTVYNSSGQIESFTNYNGVKTSYTYNSDDQVITETTIIYEGLSNEESFSVNYTYDDEGQLIQTTDSLGKIKLFEYNEEGQPISETRVVGLIDGQGNSETDDVTTSVTYDVYGNVLTRTGAVGLTTTYEYDSAGRLTKVTLPTVADPQNGGTLTAPVYEYGFDDYGNMDSITDPLDRVTNFTFGDFFNQTERTLPVVGSEYLEYDDALRPYRSTSFEGNVVDSIFTEEGFLAELQYHDPGSDPDVDSPDESVSYTYDEFDRVVQIDSSVGTTTYSYNDDGLITQISSPEGIINYEYDDFGRKLKTTTGDPSINVQNDIRYTYDIYDRLETVTVIERNDSVLSTSEVTTYSYDTEGNLTRVDHANGVVTIYEYNDLHQLDLITHYSPDGTPNDLSNNDKLAEYDYTVRADGKRTAASETYWDGSTAHTSDFTWVYDDLGRLIEETFDDDTDNSLDFHAFYTYDLVGNRLKKEVDTDLDSDIDETTTYTYNNADQLLTESTVIGLVDDGTNMETDDTTTTYTYTGTLQTGKEVKETYSTTVLTDTTSEYNLQGRLSEVTIDTYTSGSISKREVTEYEYDDKGIRVSAHHTVDDGNDSSLEVDETTTYLNDPMNFTGYSQVLEEYTYDNLTTSDVETILYTLGYDQLNQTRYNTSTPSGEILYFLTDGHGSVRLLVDDIADFVENYAYDAYGLAIGFDPVVAQTSYLYSGEQFDAETGQQYLRARYYDMATGRFNRLDPYFGNLRDPQSLHKYLYTHADPVNGVDPSGLYSLSEILVTIADHSKANAKDASTSASARASSKLIINFAKVYNRASHIVEKAQQAIEWYQAVKDLFTFSAKDLERLKNSASELMDIGVSGNLPRGLLDTKKIKLPARVAKRLRSFLKIADGPAKAAGIKGGAQELAGEMFTHVIVSLMGFRTMSDWTWHSIHGPDQIASRDLNIEGIPMLWGIFEAKGGTSKLGTSKLGNFTGPEYNQMSGQWLNHWARKIINDPANSGRYLENFEEAYGDSNRDMLAVVVSLNVNRTFKNGEWRNDRYLRVWAQKYETNLRNNWGIAKRWTGIQSKPFVRGLR
ncbi:MAG: RHS repeat-associated core domain-containing protein, partial [Planctomycetaceae bacterium]|nr:RHS repeat-associated core domain-containing protein [Planctomycetaceae bacterium]